MSQWNNDWKYWKCDRRRRVVAIISNCTQINNPLGKVNSCSVQVNELSVNISCRDQECFTFVWRWIWSNELDKDSRKPTPAPGSYVNHLTQSRAEITTARRWRPVLFQYNYLQHMQYQMSNGSVIANVVASTVINGLLSKLAEILFMYMFDC